jgi:hypothetical protein
MKTYILSVDILKMKQLGEKIKRLTEIDVIDKTCHCMERGINIGYQKKVRRGLIHFCFIF